MIKLLCFMIFCCTILIFMIVKQNIHIKKINTVLEEIEKGNLNQRIRLDTRNKNIKNLCHGLNALVEKFQKNLIEYKNVEESRKKMISNISHDLRTPLTSLLGYIEAMKNDFTLSEKEKNKYLQVIDSKAKVLHFLLEDFFTLSKIEAKDITLHFKKINIVEITKEIILAFYEDFIKINIEPEINLPKEAVFILGDEKGISRIFSNLLSNALKYGKDGGRIGISIQKEKEIAVIKIWDNGRGIPKKDIPFVFDRLYTLENSRNNKLQGTGLGLTIVKNLIEKHHGKIHINSEPNEKTEFVFTLPLFKE